MFDNLSGNLKEQQEELKHVLDAMVIESKSLDEEIQVEVNGNGVINNISINLEALSSSDKEKLEDLLLVTLNNALQSAKAKEIEESQKLIQSMLPSGLAGLSNIFGK